MKLWGIGNSDTGYATMATCLLLPIVILCLGLITFSILKTRHSQEIKTACRYQYHGYFSQVRWQINALERLNPVALSLYQAQLAMFPFIWVPAVLKLYQKLLKLRQKLEKMQNLMIKTFNAVNSLRVYQAISMVQRKLHHENTKIKSLLNHGSNFSFHVNPKLQITKRMEIIFPPYDPDKKIRSKQEFSMVMRNQITPKSWISFLKIQKLNEIYSCSATLQVDKNQKLIINYDI